MEPSALIHKVGFLTGMAALVFIELDLNITMKTDWEIFTSRLFLSKEESRKEFEYITYLITVAVIASTTSHLLSLIGRFSLWVTILELFAVVALAGAMFETYRLKKYLHVKEKD